MACTYDKISDPKFKRLRRIFRCGRETNAVSDVFRALRDVGSGDEVRLTIKRSKRSESITVTMPENRFGLRLN